MSDVLTDTAWYYKLLDYHAGQLSLAFARIISLYCTVALILPKLHLIMNNTLCCVYHMHDNLNTWTT